MEQHLPLCLMIFFMFLGFAGSLLAFKHHIRPGLASRSWPSTKGVVVESVLDEGVSPYSSTNTVIYQPFVSYEYQVKGETYVSSRVKHPGFRTSDRRVAEDILDRYQERNKVTVFFDPESPDIAVLEQGLGTHSKLLLIPPVFFSIGVTGVILALKFMYKLW